MDIKLYEVPTNIKNAIYLLVHDDKVVYVGKTRNGIKRISEHSKKVFEKVGFIECKENELDYYEDFYIMKYQPLYNRTYSCYRMTLKSAYSKLGEVIKRNMNIFEFTQYLESKNIKIDKFKEVLTITKNDFKVVYKELNGKEYA